MKKNVISNKRVLSIALALLLTLLLPAACLADAWVPPDNYYNYHLAETDAGDRTVSLFVSNYAETGMAAYSDATPSADLCAVVLKDLEINASQMKSGLTVGTGADGQQYMTVTADKFENRAASLFPNSTVRASDCPGYSGGEITVTASHVNGPIEIAATVDYTKYVGNYNYDVDFTVWQVNTGSLSAVYGRTYDVPEAKVTKLCGGKCTFVYKGSVDETDVSTWDLELVRYELDGSIGTSYAYLEPNVAYTPAAAAATNPPAVENTEAAAQSDDAATDASDSDTASANNAQTDAGEKKGVLERLFGGNSSDGMQEGAVRSGNRTLLLVLILAVVVIVLLAVLIIVMIIKKN